MTKQITWVINNITQVGGIERVVCNLSNFFVDNDYKVKIISLNTSKGEPFFKLSSKVIIQHLDYPVAEILNRKKLKSVSKELLKKENGKSDIIITCHPWIAMPLLQQKKEFNGKIICTEHATWDYYSKKRQLLNIIYYRRADRLIVLSKHAQIIYAKHHIKNLSVIPNIITYYPKKLAPLNSKELIAVGRLTAIKGFDKLIEAINLIKNDFQSWHLTIYGDGEEKEFLNNLITKYKINHLIMIATFTDQIQKKYQQSSGFIISSHNESFSMVALEALSNGVPIISFKIPALIEIDKGKNNIIFAEKDNIEDLAKKIRYYINSDNKKDRGVEARNISLEYSLENIGPIWLNLIEML